MGIGLSKSFPSDSLPTEKWDYTNSAGRVIQNEAIKKRAGW